MTGNTNAPKFHHYSTTEQVVGTWIDGKPIYEKTYLVNNVPTHSWQPIIEESGIEIVDYDFFINMIDSNGDSIFATTGMYDSTAYAKGFINTAASNGELNNFAIYWGHNDTTKANIRVTLRYIKTTDTV